MPEFPMFFAGSQSIRTGTKEKKVWYMNQGNVGEESWLSWNPMPEAAKLIKIRAVLAPSYDYGQCKISIVKNNKIQSCGVFIPAKESYAEADLNLDFGVNDYIALAIEMEDITTEVVPSACLIFTRS